MVHPENTAGGNSEDTYQAMQDLEVALALAGVLSDEDMQEDLATIYGEGAAASYMAGLGGREFSEDLDSYL